jgi:hypothetical protein
MALQKTHQTRRTPTGCALNLTLYLIAMRALAAMGLLTLSLVPIMSAQQPCAESGNSAFVQRVKASQSQLLSVKVHDEIDEEVPPPLQAEIRAFKDALTEFADATLACTSTSTDPKILQNTIATELDANHPIPQQVYDQKKPPQLDQIYGSNLEVKLTAPSHAPRIVLIEFNLGIECGYDTVLLAYEIRGGKWQRVLRWQNPDYDEISGAFGDFFDYEVMPQNNSGNWLLAVARGFPWCTSNLSAFHIDLLQPSSTRAPQKLLFHQKGDYRRDEDPVMKPAPNGFQLRMLGESLDMSIVMRPVIYRYVVLDGRLQRVQPIAKNGRDFVDEWLESPWDEATRWSAPANQDSPKTTHAKIEGEQKSFAENTPLRTYGPVRGCSDSTTHFQVQLDAEWIDNKGKSTPGKSTYFEIQEGKNSFTMLSASGQPDARCIGPDIMPKQQ